MMLTVGRRTGARYRKMFHCDLALLQLIAIIYFFHQSPPNKS